jgi:hypothetical protein
MTTFLELIENKFKYDLNKLNYVYFNKYNITNTKNLNYTTAKINFNDNYNKYLYLKNNKINEFSKKNILNHTVGFIILRYVNNNLTNKYWIKSYNSIRQYYPENHIIIIDDNSNYDFITNKKLYKTTIIKSEYPKRGELLPYYYFLHNKLFDVAVFIHDSVFINSYIDFSVEKYKILWEFEHYWDKIEDETKMINIFKDKELTDFYNNKHLWKGCLGCMSIISHDFLTHINNKYDLSKLLDCVLSRNNRMSLERIISCIFQKEAPKETLLGNIHNYCQWGLTINDIDKYKHLPIIKVWTGR